ncbi:MAG: MFS transporter [Candidatus Woesearchaeota archaeon]
MSIKSNQNQRAILINGVLWAIYDSFTSVFLAAFALALGANNTVVGILGSLPFVALVLAEIPGAKLVEFLPRKVIYVIFSSFSRASWLLLLLVPYLFKSNPIAFVSVFYFVGKFFEWLTDPSWTSLVADIVPTKIRGEFFGLRQAGIAFAGMIALVLGGLYLDIFPKGRFIGFSSLFAVGLVFGLASVVAFSRVREPTYRDHDHHKLKDFFSLKGELRKFMLIMALFNFAVFLASPLFTVYMLRNLGMSYTFYAAAAALSTLVKILSYKRLGRIADRYGNKPVAFLSMFGTALVPLSFIFITPTNRWLVVPAQILSGIVWAGMDITSFTLLLELTSAKRRAVEVAEFQIITTLPIIAASILGGWIADNLVFVLSGIPLVFALAFLLRLISALCLLKVSAVAQKKSGTIVEVLKEIAIDPIKGLQNRLYVFSKRIVRLTV